MTTIRPASAAMSPWRSDSSPSVAETCFWLMTSSLIGMAPEFS